ncbi:MAG: hypothetical protein WC467_03530 [Patescibacteria group bacterium]
MALDDELIERGNEASEKADDLRSDAPDYGNEEENSSSDRVAALREAQKGGGSGISRGDLRADIMEAKRQRGLKAGASKMVTAALSPTKKGMAGALRWSWLNLIPTFGLSLFAIDAIVFLRMVFGEKLIPDLGEEWIPKKPV